MANSTLRPKHKIRCQLCGKYFLSVDDYVLHLERYHRDSIPENMVPWQYYYYLKTQRTHGNCVICKGETGWNPITHKYNRFCTNPACKSKYRDTFKNRMINTYGKITLCDDPEQQRKMLEARAISKTYTWSTDPRIEFRCTGSYELSFLEFLDQDMHWDPQDIMAPSPHTYRYIYEGKEHFYFPDFFIPSLDLEIEIKDGGSNPNTHPKIVEVDKEKERLKDLVMASNKNTFNYLKISDKTHIQFFKYLEAVKTRFEDGTKGKICML